MPTYLYKCTACNKEFEVKQSIHDSPLQQCPTDICHGRGNVERVISPAVPIFTGKGFYETDYKKKSGGKPD